VKRSGYETDEGTSARPIVQQCAQQGSWDRGIAVTSATPGADTVEFAEEAEGFPSSSYPSGAYDLPAQKSAGRFR